MTIEISGLRPVTELPVFADIVVGLGARCVVAADEILAMILAELSAQDAGPERVAFCVTHPDKLDHPALCAVARTLGVPLLSADAAAFSRLVPNPSRTVERLTGRASVAEAAALAFGPLLSEKARSAGATCALARLPEPYWPSAASAAATLSTSSAG